jgi:hypothetical protein
MSSGSSDFCFCILGVSLAEDMIPRNLRRIWRDEDNDPGEILDALLSDEELDWVSDEEGYFYLGQTIENLDENLSIKENKEIVRKKLSKSLGYPEEKLNVEFHMGIL